MSDKLFKPHSITHASTRTHRTMFSLRTGDGTRTMPQLSKHVTCRRFQTFIGSSSQAYTREAYADGGPCTPTAVNFPRVRTPTTPMQQGGRAGQNFHDAPHSEPKPCTAMGSFSDKLRNKCKVHVKTNLFWTTVTNHALKLLTPCQRSSKIH